MDELILPQNAVYDNPSEYDILRSEYAEWLSKWKIADKYKIKVRNQNANQDTLKWCSAYWLTGIYNWYQLREYDENWIEFEQEDPRWKWLAFQAERWYPNSWASLQEMMSFFKKRGLIDGYVKSTTVQECRNAINNWCLIYTWSNKCNWSKTSKAKKFVYDPNGAAHCFFIEDFNDEWFIAVNSFWENRWDNGRFTIPFDDYGNIYSTYAIIDHDDTGKLAELVFNAQYQKAIELWITNWTRPDDNVSRKEAAVMAYRVYKMLK